MNGSRLRYGVFRGTKYCRRGTGVVLLAAVLVAPVGEAPVAAEPESSLGLPADTPEIPFPAAEEPREDSAPDRTIGLEEAYRLAVANEERIAIAARELARRNCCPGVRWR